MLSLQRRTVANTLGVGLLVFAAVWRWGIAPQVLKLPKDFSFSANIISVDNFFDEEFGGYRGEQYSKTDYDYRVVDTTPQTLNIEHTFDVKTLEGDSIVSLKREYAVDRVTGAHVDGGDRERDGYLFAPQGLRPGETFTYWHVNYDAPAQMTYVGKEILFGLPVYHYESFYEGEQVDQTDNLTFLPGVGVDKGVILQPHLEVWVEPVTGRLVDYRDETVASYYDLATNELLNPWNKFSNTFEPESVQKNVQTVFLLRTLFRIVEFYLPFVCGFLGVWLLVRKRVGRYVTRHPDAREAVWRTIGGVGVGGTAFLLLLNWKLQWVSVWLGFPGGASMNPVTAVGFCLMGLAISLHRKHRVVRTGIMGVVFFGSFVQFLGMYEVLPVLVDQLLFPKLVAVTHSKMSLFTVVGFMGLSLAVMAANFQRLRNLFVTRVLALTVGLLSWVVLGGYAFASSWILSFMFFSGAALYTAVLMAVCAMVIFHLCHTMDSVLIPMKGRVLVGGVLFMSVIFTIVTTSLTDQLFRKEAQDAFEVAVDRAVHNVEYRLGVYINALNGAEALLASSQHVERSEWKQYVDSLEIQEHYPGIQGVGYAVVLQPGEVADHVAQVRAEGFPEYAIRPSGERGLYTSIVYLEPFDARNRQAFGFDMFQEPVRRFAMQNARDTGEPNISGVITLVQEIDSDVQPGFLIYVPHYKKNSGQLTPKDRTDAILGYAYGAFRARDFFEGVFQGEPLDQIGLRAHDSILDAKDRVLYDDLANMGATTTTARFHETRTLFFAGRYWTMEFYSTPEYGLTSLSRWMPFLVLCTGIGASVLLALVFFVVFSSQQRAQTYADEVTKDLQKEKAKDEAILTSVGDGLVATDETGRVILVNDMFERILGWKESEAQGRLLSELVPMWDAQKHKVPLAERSIAKTLQGKKAVSVGTSEQTIYYQRKDGELLPVSISVSPILVDGEVVGAVEIFRDITKEKQIDQAKTEFVSLASHQLRTPLTAMRWNLELLLEGAQKERLSSGYQKVLGELDGATQRLIGLVKALLSTSRIDLGTFEIRSEEVDVRALVETVVSEQKPMATAKKLRIRSDVKEAPRSYLADPELLLMVVQNLLSNAVKYTVKGSVSVSVQMKDRGPLTISVKDTGLGIPEAQQKEIFGKLFRADNVKNDNFEGTGLGLYIVKSIVETAGGSIRFTSREGEGTEFIVKLPRSGMKKRQGTKRLDA